MKPQHHPDDFDDQSAQDDFLSECKKIRSLLCIIDGTRHDDSEEVEATASTSTLGTTGPWSMVQYIDRLRSSLLSALMRINVTHNDTERLLAIANYLDGDTNPTNLTAILLDTPRPTAAAASSETGGGPSLEAERVKLAEALQTQRGVVSTLKLKIPRGGWKFLNNHNDQPPNKLEARILFSIFWCRA